MLQRVPAVLTRESHNVDVSSRSNVLDVPIASGIISAILLLCQSLAALFSTESSRNAGIHATTATFSTRGVLEVVGGSTIFAFRGVQLLCVIVLWIMACTRLAFGHVEEEVQPCDFSTILSDGDSDIALCVLYVSPSRSVQGPNSHLGLARSGIRPRTLHPRAFRPT